MKLIHRKLLASVSALAAVSSALVFAACASSTPGGFAPLVDGGGTAAHGDSSYFSFGDGGQVIEGDGSAPILTGGDGSISSLICAITPATSSLTVVSGQPVPTQQLSCTSNGQAVAGVKWSTNQGAIGKIDATGKFTPNGSVGGVATITAFAGGQTAAATVTVNLQMTDLGDPGWSSTPKDAGAGGYGGVGGAGPGAAPTSSQQTTLNGTPSADTAVSLLYPYDGTVWPQGLLAPLVQWNPGAHAFDSVYIHIQENNFEYKGYFATNVASPGAFVNVPIPAQAWTSMAYSNSGEPVTVSLVFGQGGTAYGPYTETWTIAQATLQGTIYYNSYGTALVKNSNDADSYGHQYGAGTLAITTGATAPTLVGGVNSADGTGCRVCHTVAANGQSLVTQNSSANASTYAGTVAIDLANDPTGGAGTLLTTPNLTFPALYKDGSMLLSSAANFPYPGSTLGTSQLYSVPSGNPVAGVTGLPAGLQAGLPTFSPDGAHVAFNFWGGSFSAGSGGTKSGDQTSLGMLDFDGNKTFANPRVVYTPPSGTSVTYSSFFPDASGVVFEIELTNPTSNWAYTWSNTATTGNTGELWWLDVATGNAHRLDALNGYSSSGAVYLPSPASNPQHTPAQDATLNYEATVNPIASGGYVWVVFTSRRMYGNVAQLNPWASDPRHYAWQDQVTDKKLWVAAVDLNAKPGTDPSHPAFYLPAQELHAGNSRGYWTVEPCRADGQSCIAGDQCCAGFCEPVADGGLECTSQVPTCAQQFDKCTQTSDCCGASTGIQCINGVCTLSVPK